MRALFATTFLAGALGAAGLLAPPRVQACGGLFCNAAQPVNQAAERILFVQNADQTQTAVIEIQYEGPSESFSWVLPVPGSPKVGVSSKAAFDRLQAATNPQFLLNRTTEDGCKTFGNTGGGNVLSPPTASRGTADDAAGPPPVTVIAMGTVGPFDYQVISVRDDLASPADAAVMWLEDNGYDVTALGPSVLGPYLADGLNLIGFRLTKNGDTGSVRPIVITYDAKLPFIPIRPTAVAANPDMGILVWVASQSRTIPDNFKALEINEALIDWFNPMNTYGDVVTRAADEAGGQGFVTELAAKSDTLEGVILQSYEEQEWMRISTQSYASGLELFNDALNSFGGWDGFADVIKEPAVTLPQGESAESFIGCPNCFVDTPGFSIDQAALLKALYEKVYKPLADTDALLLSRPYVTRLYTTMSAEEMTTDPVFNFNSDLPDVSNTHMATLVQSCQGDTWHMELPQGDVVYGTEANVWPMDAMDEQPAARKVLSLSTAGSGHVDMDNSADIARLLHDSALDRGDTAVLAPNDRPQLTGGGGDSGCSVAGADAVSALAGHAALWSLALGLVARRRRPGR